MTIAEWERRQKEEIEKQKLKPLQKISNNFLDNTLYKSSASAIKTIYYLSSIIEKMDQLLQSKHDESLFSIQIDAKQMLKYTGMSLPEIRRNIKAMQRTSITFIDEKQKIEKGLSLLPKYEIMYGKSKIEINIFVKIAKMIVEVKKNYTFINTKDIMQLKSKHSLRMLPLLHKIANYDEHVAKRKTMTLLELNEFFGTKYKNLSEIERKILILIQQELNEISNLTFIYEINFINLGIGRPKSYDITIDVIKKK
jgi:plasmid replication initiation protein